MIQTKDFPPQAYTKETVSEAFIWLQSQPDEVKKTVTHTNQLVSLYLKNKCQQYWTSKTNASKNTDGNHDFNNQLQEMALEMTSLAQTAEDPDTHLNGNSPISNEKKDQTSSVNCLTVPKPRHNTSSSNSLNGSASSNSTSSNFPHQNDIQNQETLLSTDLKKVLDVKSLKALEDAKTKLNLSSTVEAARLLITLGLEQIKLLFPSSK